MTSPQIVPMITARDLPQTRAFYAETLGFDIVFDMPAYLQVRSPGGADLAFVISGDGMPPMGKGPHRATFDGAGLVLSVRTDDVDGTAKAVQGRGAELLMNPEDKPWGWRSFMTRDPNGVVLDFYSPLAQPDEEQAGSDLGAA